MESEVGVTRRGPILLVDDDESCLEVMVFILEEEGYQVVRACNGIEALARLESGRFAVLVTDLKMPELDGLALLEKAHGIDPNLVAIGTSAFNDPVTVRAAMEAGAFVFLPKPCDRDCFRQTVRRAFEIARTRRFEEAMLAGVTP